MGRNRLELGRQKGNVRPNRGAVERRAVHTLPKRSARLCFRLNLACIWRMPVKIAPGVARLCVPLALLINAPSLAADPIDLDTDTIVLARTKPELDTVDALAYRGGLELSSNDPRFGGLSGLVVGANGERLVAISDRGHWFEARLVYEADGRLAALADPSMSPLLDETGTPLTGKLERDAESLASAPGGGFLVSFERHHRILHYAAPGATAQPVDFVISDLSDLDHNLGIEAMEYLDDGRLLLVAEDHFVSDGQLASWLIDDKLADPLSYPGNGYFKPTDLARLADGRLLVIERGRTRIRGRKARLMLIESPSGPGAISDPTELARFQPPFQVESYEGLASRTADNGETLIYIISDDDFSGLQRTLLLMFALVE